MEENYKDYLASTHWQALAMRTRRDRNYKCERCADVGRDSQAYTLHHQFYFKNGISVLYNEDQYPDCLLLVCNACHRFLHKVSEYDPTRGMSMDELKLKVRELDS